MYAALLSSLLLSAGPSGRAERVTPVVRLVRSAGPAVVNITTELGRGPNPFARGRLGGWPFAPRQRQGRSLGSGVIIDAGGLVLTNEHVVSQASEITVRLADRRSFKAEVVGADPDFDIAVLRLRMPGKERLPAVRIGRSDDLMIGETVVAIGNPYGLSNTVTRGVVSALHRSLQTEHRHYEDFIQTDATIHPGSSGGALFNIHGELIGINTAVHTGGGIGFSIPVDKAKAVVDEVLRYGEVRPVYSGVLLDRRYRGRGAQVRAAEGPAAQAGLRAGDVIVDVGGAEVDSAASFLSHLSSMVPGQQQQLKVRRGGRELRLSITLRSLSADRAAQLGAQRLGLEVRAVGGRLRITRVAPRSGAAQLGIRRGDLLLSIGGRRLSSRQDFQRACAAAAEASAVSVVIGRGGRAYYATLELGR